MKRSMMAALAVVVLMMSLVGCGEKTQHDVYKEIYKRYTDIRSFYSEVEITVKNEKMSSVYSARQFYEAPDRFALVIDSPEEVAGSGYTAKDGKFLLKSGFGSKESVTIAFPDEKSTVFLCDFLEEYYKSEETFLETSGGFSGNKTTLTCYISGGSEKRFMQSLEIDNDTYLPIKLSTYDIEKNPVVEVRFGEFKRNSDIDERIFN